MDSRDNVPDSVGVIYLKIIVHNVTTDSIGVELYDFTRYVIIYIKIINSIVNFLFN